jgi:precorrin-2 dehydrogenase/sirohydrochlorin ferrochelatase
MRYLPINLDIRDKLAVVVGGGMVAARKCAALLESGARVTVVAPALDDSIKTLVADRRIRHVAREFMPGDLEGAFLVFAATDEHGVNIGVAREAAARAILADVADAPGLGSFTMPAVMRQGSLQIAVSTEGKSPALARQIRDRLAETYGPDYAAALEILGNLRTKLLTAKGNNAYNKQIFDDLAARLPAMIGHASPSEIDNLLSTLLGPGFTLADLASGGKDSE